MLLSSPKIYFIVGESKATGLIIWSRVKTENLLSMGNFHTLRFFNVQKHNWYSAKLPGVDLMFPWPVTFVDAAGLLQIINIAAFIYIHLPCPDIIFLFGEIFTETTVIASFHIFPASPVWWWIDRRLIIPMNCGNLPGPQYTHKPFVAVPEGDAVQVFKWSVHSASHS